MARLRATALAARSVLDGREHDGMLGRVGGPSAAHNQTSKSGNAGPSKNEIMLTIGVAVPLTDALSQLVFRGRK